MEWTTRPLEEIAELYDSLHQTPQYVDDGFPMIRVTDIRRGFVDTSGAVRVDENTYRQFSQKHKPQVGDILFSRVGSYGNSAYVESSEEFCLGQNTVCIAPNKDFVESFFLYCCFNSPMLEQQIESLAGGASQGTISLKSIRILQIPLPPLPIQRRIAEILSAYDDLIAVNRRRIALLETAARELYREWFVRRRFPGYESVEVRDGVPKGWRLTTIDEIVEQKKQSVHPSKIEPLTPYVGLEHIPRMSIALNDWGAAGDVNSQKSAFAKNDILFGKIRPYFHKVVFAPVSGVCSSDAIVIQPREDFYFGFSLCVVSSEDFVAAATQSSNGTGMPRANWSAMIKYSLLLPDKCLLLQFDSLIRQVTEQIGTLVFANQKLQQARDGLLPRLLDGRLAVEAAEPM